MRRHAWRFVAAAAALAASADALAGPSLWEEVAHPNRRRCAQIVDEAGRLRGAGEKQAASQAARKAVALCPDEREILQAAGETLLDARELPEARQLLERARTLAEATPGSHADELSMAFLLGFAREVTGDLDGAIVEHRRLEALGGLPAPNQYLVHYDLGDELMASGRLGEAIEEYRRAAVLAPERPRPLVHLALAVALDRDERFDQSRAELSVVLSLDPELRRLASEEYIFVPAADVHYYRALALLERGAPAEARLALRTFVAELPAGPFAGHARRRLAEVERMLDPRELELTGPPLDKRTVAQALAPAVAALESCLPPGRVVRVPLVATSAGLRAEPRHPAAECLNQSLSRVDTAFAARLKGSGVVLPLAGRRGAASLR